MNSVNKTFYELIKVTIKSVLDLIKLFAIFLILISPGILKNYDSILKFFTENTPNLFISVTGFNIPGLILPSMIISIKLILFSLIISGFFGILIALLGSFKQDFYWLPNIFVAASSIPVFITAFYLPSILGIIFFVCIHLLLFTKLKNKALCYFVSFFFLVLSTIVTVAYCSKIGALDIFTQNPPSFLPKIIQSRVKEIIHLSKIMTESVILYFLPVITVGLFAFFSKKYPLHRSLTKFVSFGFLFVFTVIAYCYNTKINSSYLLAPVLSLAIGNLVIGQFINHIRREIREEIQFEYIKAAIARGASVWDHIKRKTLILTLNTFKTQFVVLLSLTAVVEKIYNLEGLGFLAWEYTTRQSDIVTVSWIVGLSFVLVWIFANIVNCCLFFVYPPGRENG